MIPIKVVLADDHRIVRECMRALLGQEPNVEVIGEVGDGLQVGDTVARLNPDVLLLDLKMPGLDGLEVIPLVQKRSPHVRIIVLSMHSDEAHIYEALRKGAVGYVLKDSSVEDLVAAIRTAQKCARYISPSLAATLPEEFTEEALQTPPDPYDRVTTREREVLQLAADGATNDDIARKLSISPRTAEVHRTHVLEKLHVHNQTGLVKYAVRKGLVSLHVHES